MGPILLLIALLLNVMMAALWWPYCILYYFFTFKWKSGIKQLNLWFYEQALIVDIYANVMLGAPMNYFMVKKGSDYFPFGGRDRDTLSYVIAMNQQRGTLSRHGRFWAWFLDFVDKDHLNKAIKYKHERYTAFFEN